MVVWNWSLKPEIKLCTQAVLGLIKIVMRCTLALNEFNSNIRLQIALLESFFMCGLDLIHSAHWLFYNQNIIQIEYNGVS